jgi:LmbE family N-acetylglucosaminyl deacetylase
MPRGEAMTRTIISPHLDDAVLSLGQFMATEHCMVVTVFAGVPVKGTLSEYDKSCGFDSSHKAMTYRRAEDDRACAELGATPVHWDYLDAQYVTPANEQQLRADLARMALGGMPFFPLGLGHPDHRTVAREARAAVEHGRIFVYEELPYRIMWPEQAHAALDEIRAEGWTIDDVPAPLQSGPLDRKRAAIGRYRSQFPRGAEDPMLLCPERVWRCSRP